MGKQNRQRRAAKQRKRQTHGGGRQRGWVLPGPAAAAPPPSVRDLLLAASWATDGDAATALFDRLAALPADRVAIDAAAILEDLLGHLWNDGWQPVDVERIVRRELGADDVVVLQRVLAAESARYEQLGRQVAPHWMAQLADAGATRTWAPGEPYLARTSLPWARALASAVRLLGLLERSPRLPLLIPPPDQWHAAMAVAAPSNLPPGLLDKVRALLAKAEATTFDAEAEAFTAKAQELMARHRIDRAVLAADGGAGIDDDVIIGRRLTIDDPYADTKALLLGAIADANGAHAVWSKGLGFSTVFAHRGELDVIEELFTSLLVQATAALRREGSKQDRSGRSRTTRFRRSFLVSFAHRIGERLRERVEQTVADAEMDSAESLLPILAARDDEVRGHAERLFPDATSFRPSASDREGWYAGRLFADHADVAVGDPLAERAAS